MDLRDEIAAAAAGARHADTLLKDDKPRLMQLVVANIRPDETQPRRDLGDLTELAESIRAHGILQPITVVTIGLEMYQIVTGHRRWAAARELKLNAIPCIVRTIDEHKRLEMQVIENIHRKAFTPVEEAKAYLRLIEEYGHRQEDLAKVIGRSRATINQTLRILDLPEQILLKAEERPDISSSVLLEIARHEDRARQIELFQRAVNGTLTVRALREEKAAVPTPKPPIPPERTFKTKTSQAEVTIKWTGPGDPNPRELAMALEEIVYRLKKRVS